MNETADFERTVSYVNRNARAGLAAFCGLCLSFALMGLGREGALVGSAAFGAVTGALLIRTLTSGDLLLTDDNRLRVRDLWRTRWIEVTDLEDVTLEHGRVGLSPVDAAYLVLWKRDGERIELREIGGPPSRDSRHTSKLEAFATTLKDVLPPREGNAS